MKVKSVSRSVMTDSLQPKDKSPPGFSICGILKARILGWAAHPFLQGVFLTQGLNLGLLHCRQILNHLSHQGRPYMYIRKYIYIYIYIYIYTHTHTHTHIYIFIYKLNHFAVHLKLTQHCESSILQFKKSF